MFYRRKIDPSSHNNHLPPSSGKTIPAAKKKRSPAQRPPKQPSNHNTQVNNISTAVHMNNVSMSDGHMTPEEVERHLQSRQSFLELERAPLTVPTEMFSNEPSLDRYINLNYFNILKVIAIFVLQ